LPRSSGGRQTLHLGDGKTMGEASVLLV
jgi:hypothetical protein